MRIQPTPTLYALLGACVPCALRDVVPKALVLNSQQVNDGDLFVALRGNRANGLDYLHAAAKAGALAALVDESEKERVKDAPLPIIYVANLAARLSALAGEFYASPSKRVKVVGITGTNGKSTCSLWLAQLLQRVGRQSAVIGTLGYGVPGQALQSSGMTTPDAIECQRIFAELVDLSVKTVAMEVSSHAIDQHRVAGIDFDVAVFTNLSRDHLDYHGSMERYAATKMAFIEAENIPFALVNIDDAHGAAVYHKVMLSSRQCFSYSLKQQDADICADNILFHGQGISATIMSIWGRADVNLPIIGDFNLANMLAVIASACIQGERFDDVIAAAHTLAPVNGRMQAIDVGDHADKHVAIYIDYAHTPDALEKALLTLKLHIKQKLWLVFGCGGDRDTGKRSLMGEKAARYADHIVVTSDNPRTEEPQAIIDDILKGIDKNIDTVICLDRKQAIVYAVNHAGEGDCILIAGKGHEDYQIIGNERQAFNDAEVAALALQNLSKNKASAKHRQASTGRSLP